MPTESHSRSETEDSHAGSRRPEGERLAESEISLEAAMEILEERGYHEQLHPEGDELRFAGDRRGFHASEFIVEGQVRAESDSTLEYSSLVLALRHLPTGRAGTLVAPFGTTGDAASTHAVELLEELEEHPAADDGSERAEPVRDGGRRAGGL